MYKKIIISAALGLTVGAVFSPVVGMAIGSTRNLILGMAPKEAILALADRIDEQAIKNQEHEEKMSELGNVNAQQKEGLQKLSEAEEVRKKEEEEQKKMQCEAKLKNTQDSLAGSQRNLDSDQKLLDLIASEKEYKQCKKQAEDKYSEDKKDNDPEGKKRYDESMSGCKEHQKDELANRKSDVQGDQESIKRQEIKLQEIKNECNQYLNN